METEIITGYVLSDNLPKAMGILEDIQVKMSNAEVMTAELTAARFPGDTLMRRIFFMKTVIFRIC